MSEYVKYLDETLPFEERARDLVSRMTLHEVAGQLLFTAKGVDRLGVHDYNWWNEALHGVARTGTATVFPQAIGMAASFDPDLMKSVGDVISTEGRAKYNGYQKKHDYQICRGLTYWSPNVNIFRDPRWGRGQETYGEDPYLSGVLGTAFVKGLQGDDPRYLKAAGCAKHFAVHSGPERLRHEFDAKASKKDMEETYLPQFRMLVEAGVEGVMGAYNRTNGEVCCGSKTLLKDTLREKWGFKGYVTSDCWAVNDFHEHHKVTDTPQESVKLALENGCQLNCGCAFEYVQMAVESGMLSEDVVREAAVQLMTTRMKLGEFDRETPWDGLTILDSDTPEHAAVNLKMAHESMVLLKNNGILPLKKDLKLIHVTGPNAANITALNGNYHGIASRYVTVLDALRNAFPEARILFSEAPIRKGPDWEPDGSAEVEVMAEQADLTICVTGLDETIEGEEDAVNLEVGDRSSLCLPECQQKTLKAIERTGKPYIIVNLTGSAVDFGTSAESASAILQVWYPGALGGQAAADVLTGVYSPSGKLPVTFYRNDGDLPDFCDYSMENRTYKYYTGTPLYPFGFGLSYADFEFSAPAFDEKTRTASVTVTNRSGFEAETAVQFYLKDNEASVSVPRYRLAGFKHVTVPAGTSMVVSCGIPELMFMIVTEEGERMMEHGSFTLFAGDQQPDERSTELTGKKVTSLEIEY